MSETISHGNHDHLELQVLHVTRRGEEYLLERKLVRRKSTGEVVNPAWRQFSFPTRGGTRCGRCVPSVGTSSPLPEPGHRISSILCTAPSGRASPIPTVTMRFKNVYVSVEVSNRG